MRIMNIKVNDKTISADYEIPNGNYSHCLLDAKNGELLDNDDEKHLWLAFKVMRVIKEMIDNKEEIPSEYNYIWY